VSVGAIGIADANSGMTRPQINEATMLHLDEARQIYLPWVHLQTQLAAVGCGRCTARIREKDSQQREACWPRTFPAMRSYACREPSDIEVNDGGRNQTKSESIS
jgi:hypothetical protein